MKRKASAKKATKPKVRPAAKPKTPATAQRVDPFRELGGARKRYGRRRVVALADFFNGSRSHTRGGGYAWQGASNERSLEAVVTSSGSGNADLAYELPTLRERSRALVRNCALARGAVRSMVTHVVGPGIAPQSRVNAEAAGITPAAAEAWQRRAEYLFGIWAGSRNADADGRWNFWAMERLAFRAALENGDTFARVMTAPAKRWPFDLRIQLLEADQILSPLGHPEGYATSGSANTITHGVEQTAAGEVVAYHIATQHPGSLGAPSYEVRRVPVLGPQTGALQVLHVTDPDRIGQARAVPYLAAVVEKLFMLDEYSRAVVMAANIGACFSAFIKTAGGGGLGLEETEDSDSANPQDYRMGPGVMLDLMPGEDVVFADPKQPQQTFGEFVLAMLRQVGAALGIPLEILIMHFTASYSATRGAQLQFTKTCDLARDWVVETFAQPVWDSFLAECVAKGYLEAPGFFDDEFIRMAYCAAQWTGPSYGHIDPEKEARATLARISGNLSTFQEECAREGRDSDQVFARLAQERAKLKALGLDIEPTAERVRTEMGPQPAKHDTDPEDQEESDEADQEDDAEQEGGE